VSAFPAGILYGVLAAVIWGAWPTGSRLGLQDALSVYDIAALRIGTSGLLLSPLIWRRGVRGIGWLGAIVLAIGAGALFVLAGVGGFSLAPASHGGVIIPSTMIVFSALGGWLALGDRPGAARLAGLVIVIVGVVLVGWDSWSVGVGGDRSWIGHLLYIAAGVLWATYTVASRIWPVDPLHAIALVTVLSMTVYLPVYVIFGSPGILAAPVADVAFQALFQGVLVGILALLFYTRAVASLGAARGALFGALVPGFAVLWAYPVLGEVPTWRELLGFATVTAGMVFVLRLRQRSSQ
jgi:drug/metabolite transporter (DMT)-like permease